MNIVQICLVQSLFDQLLFRRQRGSAGAASLVTVQRWWRRKVEMEMMEDALGAKK